MRRTTRKRSGYTLIELVTVMIAATVLLVSLASTVILSTRLMENPLEDSQQWHDREIADRLAADLRYATEVDETFGYGFGITKPNPITGTSENAVYVSYLNGLTRRIGSGPVFGLDTAAPSRQFSVDGYTAPTYNTSGNVTRVRSFSSAGSDGRTGSLQVDMPPGCKDGDLLLLVAAARTPWFLIVPAGWNYVDFLYPGSLRMRVMYSVYYQASAAPITLQSWPDAGMAATIVAIENVDTSVPIRWKGSSTGYASVASPNTHPVTLESTSLDPSQLNVQVFAAVGDPWYDGALGLSSFTDVVQATGAGGLASYATSVAVAVRSGPTPDLTTTPRVLHLTPGTWAQVGLHLGVAP